MNRLVQETGFAKGTLYLYFTTRHEILASLFAQMLTAWHHRFSESLTKARNYDEFCARYVREETYDPQFLPMLVLERRDLETALPYDTYAQVSPALQQVLREQAEVFKETSDLTDQLPSNLVCAFYTAALGVAQFSQSPNMRTSVSFEVREFQEALRFDTLFCNWVDQFSP
jgi:AcrR family transcriptional regulator